MMSAILEDVTDLVAGRARREWRVAKARSLRSPHDGKELLVVADQQRDAVAGDQPARLKDAGDGNRSLFELAIGDGMTRASHDHRWPCRSPNSVRTGMPVGMNVGRPRREGGHVGSFSQRQQRAGACRGSSRWTIRFRRRSLRR